MKKLRSSSIFQFCLGFSGQEYWSGFPFPSPGDLPNPGIEPGSPSLQLDSVPSEPPGKPLRRMVKLNLALRVMFTLLSVSNVTP